MLFCQTKGKPAFLTVKKKQVNPVNPVRKYFGLMLN
jgi:hypothetical protein